MLLAVLRAVPISTTTTIVAEMEVFKREGTLDLD